MLSILLCDDDPLFLNELQATITQILPQEQLSFTCCTKGADCMEAVQRGLIPDVAFVDIASVSYTHLDVYKRQPKKRARPISFI